MIFRAPSIEDVLVLLIMSSIIVGPLPQTDGSVGTIMSRFSSRIGECNCFGGFLAPYASEAAKVLHRQVGEHVQGIARLEAVCKLVRRLSCRSTLTVDPYLALR